MRMKDLALLGMLFGPTMLVPVHQAPAQTVMSSPVLVQQVQAPTAVSAGEFKGNIYLWKYVGRNPYGGTLEWALAQSGWPKEVQLALVERWNRDKKTVIVFSTGQKFDWMSEGGSRKGTQTAVHRNTLAQWPADEREAADSVGYSYRNVRYTLLKVHKCGNFGGLKGEILTPKPTGPIDGMIPEVVCPPEFNCCS